MGNQAKLMENLQQKHLLHIGAKKRKRKGLTSPPLPGVEVNPGPQRARRRLLASEKAKDQGRKSNPKLSDKEKGEILMGLKLGLSHRKIAQTVGIATVTVGRWQRRLLATGAMERKKGSGRKRLLRKKKNAE